VLNPGPGRAISLATYLGTNIPNWIDVDSTDGAIRLATWKLRNKIQAAIAQTGPPTGRYNCHGLTFASRRTNIPHPGMDDAGLVAQILQEDQCVQIAEIDAREGDVVLWRLGALVPHTGIVAHVQREPFRAILAVSKWGALGEYIHHPLNSPFDGCAVEYWGMR
jgi:hypothetical protein